MALTPQSNAAFIREVDEQVRLDTATAFWKRWGRGVIALGVVSLIALGAFLWWQNSRRAAAGVEGENLSIALDDLASGKTLKAQPVLKALTGSTVPGYRASAKLASADLALGKADLKTAAANYDAVAADTSLGQPYRDLALLRSVAAQFDTARPEVSIARLKPLAVAGNPWFGSAGEMTAIAYLRLGKPRDASSVLKALGRDEGVPDSIRSRAVQLATVSEAGAQPMVQKGSN